MITSAINTHILNNKNIIKKATNIFAFCKATKQLIKNSVVTKNANRTLNFLEIKHPYIESLIKDLEEEFYNNPYDYSQGEDLKILRNFPYSISYIHIIEFLEKGYELIHNNELTEDLTIVMGLNKWKPGNTFQLSFRKQSVKYPFQFKEGLAVLFNSSTAREVLKVKAPGDKMLVISLVKDLSKLNIMEKRLKKLSLIRKEDGVNNALNSKGKFSRFWRGLKNGINIFR
tara:strand:+ start:2459 stop:3145 length:687 start_codon:yes stop_codon:yes gene_type:complete